MKTIILNWKNGENDPFSVFNKTLFGYFTLAGKDVEIIEITDPDWPKKLLSHYGRGIDFVLTWQGLESRLMLNNGKRFWDHYQIPLICIHGDHPCHMPDNHSVESQYVAHFYFDPYFSIYSNRHFRVKQSANAVHTPLLHNEPSFERRRTGDFFVIAKNINLTNCMLENWRKNLDQKICKILVEISENIRQNISTPGYLNVHQLVDNYLECNDLIDYFETDINIKNVYHFIHSQIDFFARNIKSEKLITLLHDFPVQIYGRGWGNINRSKHHQFFDGLSMSESQHLFHSNFGIIDVSASIGLHDRTLRAIHNSGSFLSSADLSHETQVYGNFSSLFFDFNNTIINKCENVLRNSDEHNELSKIFASKYKSLHRNEDFVWKITSLAYSMKKNS